MTKSQEIKSKLKEHGIKASVKMNSANASRIYGSMVIIKAKANDVETIKAIITANQNITDETKFNDVISFKVIIPLNSYRVNIAIK